MPAVNVGRLTSLSGRVSESQITLSGVPASIAVDVPTAGAVLSNTGTGSVNYALVTTANLAASPSSGILAPGASQAITLTGNLLSTQVLSATNTSGGRSLGNPISIVVGNPVSASLTLTGPTDATATVASSNFQIVAADIIAPITIVPTNVAGVASFSPSSVVASPGDLTKLFTATWAAAGAGKQVRAVWGSVNSNTLSVNVAPAPPTPPPPPPPPPSAAPTGNITQFLTSDGGSASYSGNFSGPTRDKWHNRLGFAWKRTNTLGNWLDASQVEEGGSAFGTSAPITAVDQSLVITANALVSRWMSTGQNRGAYLRINSGSAFPVAFYGRTDATSANRPKLTVITSTGTFVLTAAANAYWYNSSFTGIGSAAEWRLSSSAAVAVLRFDLSTVTGVVSGATLTIKVKSFPSGGSTGQVVGLYECDPPTIIVPENPAAPVLGLADNYDDFNAFKASGDPALIAADDFELGGPFDGGFTPSATRTLNPATGTTYARGEITVGANGSANSRLEVSSGTGTQGIPNIVRPEVYGQYWLYLESDFGTTQDDAIKIPAMGVQFGYWVSTGGSTGYWQQTTGNGGSRGTGLKVDRGGSLNFEYQGHSVRFLTGTRKTALDDDPYDGWFGMGIYDYNLDQVGPFPAGASFPMVAIRALKQYCIDIRVKQNTMTGAQDGLGNYATANPDGIYQVWINGVPVYSRTNYRWRLHDEFGVQGMWIDVYHGGTSTQSAPGSHYQLDRVSLATSYIGPKAFPTWRQGQTPLTWAAIGSSVPESVDPENDAAINPNGAGNPAPWRNSSGGGDIFRAWNAWGTGVWSESAGKFRIPAQGGHDDYAGNEVYLQNLFDDSPTWVLERKPTGAIGNAGTLTQDQTSSNTQVYFDGRPRSHHGYGMFVDREGDVWSAPNGPFKTGGNGQTTFKLFKFAESTSDWTTVSSSGFPVLSNAAQGAGSMCWDESRDRFYVYPSANIQLSSYDVATGAKTQLPVYTDSGQYSAAIRIPELDIIVFLNHGYAGDLGVYDYGRHGTTSLNQPGATGTKPTYPSYSSGDWYPNGVWVPGYGGGVGAIFCWHGGTTFKVLTPPAVGDPAITAWAWSTVSAAGANVLDPGNPNSTGVWGRLFYSARLKGLGLSLQPNLPTYFFALE